MSVRKSRKRNGNIACFLVWTLTETQKRNEFRLVQFSLVQFFGSNGLSVGMGFEEGNRWDPYDDQMSHLLIFLIGYIRHHA
jgi:hypothetical protein